MFSRYITKYQRHIKNTGDIKSAVIGCLTELHKERSQWSAGFSLGKWGLRGNIEGLRLFYNKETTNDNLTVLNTIIEGIEQSVDLDEVIQIISNQRNQLSDGVTSELLDYIFKDLKQQKSLFTFSLIGSGLPDTEEYHQQREQFIKKKNLNPASFQQCDIQIDDDINTLTNWIFAHIYSKSYDTKKGNVDKIGRFHHGIQHVSRAAIYVPCLVNFYIRHGYREAFALTACDIRLMQLAILFHDAARESDGEDLWDDESGLLLYYFLVDVLNISHVKAIQLAEAVANKDADVNIGKYKKLTVNDNGKIEWLQIERYYKNIYQQIIQSADCLEILRVKNRFNANFLDLYRYVIKSPDRNPKAFDEMALLICEIRRLHQLQGDNVLQRNVRVKKEFETEDCYVKTLTMIRKQGSSILCKLYNENRPFTHEEAKNIQLKEEPKISSEMELSEKNLLDLIKHGKVFARAVKEPSFYVMNKKNKYHETNAELELYKASRKKGKQTRTKNKIKMDTEGNRNRSVSRIGFGTGLFSPVGFLIIGYDISRISDVSMYDWNSGEGKKNSIVSNRPTPAEIQNHLSEQHIKMKMGGGDIKKELEDWQNHHNHTELLYDLVASDFNAIFFSEDITLTSKLNSHKNAMLLEAIYLQQLYQSHFNKLLPIFKYSAVKSEVKLMPLFNDNDIYQLWMEMCGEYLNKKAKKGKYLQLGQMSIEAIKIFSMYGETNINKVKSIDSDYSEVLRKDINSGIENLHNALIVNFDQELKAAITNGKHLSLEELNYVCKKNLLSDELHESQKKLILQTLDDLTSLDFSRMVVAACAVAACLDESQLNFLLDRFFIKNPSIDDVGSFLFQINKTIKTWPHSSLLLIGTWLDNYIANLSVVKSDKFIQSHAFEHIILECLHRDYFPLSLTSLRQLVEWKNKAIRHECPSISLLGHKDKIQLLDEIYSAKLANESAQKGLKLRR